MNSPRTSITVFYVPVSSQKAGQGLADHLIVERHAFCAQLFPITSTYWWEHALAHENEYMLVVKTINEHAASLRTIIEQKHIYDIPCIMSLEADVNPAYFAWAKAYCMHDTSKKTSV